MDVKEAVEKYQCCGCVCGSSPKDGCFIVADNGTMACSNHVAGTREFGIGKIFLGMPTGFNRLGLFEDMKIYLFRKFEDRRIKYNYLNIPVWKYLDKHGNTLVRGMCPRVNLPFMDIFLENCIDKIDCYEITKEDLDGMD